jgi:RNA polymerase sigma-70 factor (ECF subfamily)
VDQAAVSDLVEQAQKGDRGAFGSLMEMHQEQLYRLAYRLTGQAEAAEAVTQDAFVQAYRSLRQFQGRSSFMTWLYTIAVRKAADRHRENKRTRVVRSLDRDTPLHDDARRPATPDPLEELQGKELAERLSGAITELPPDQRAALVLIAQEGLSYRDAAGALGCSEGTLAWRVWNARRLLRDRLKGRI